MKKEYVNPALEVVKIQAVNQILAGSDPALSGEYTPGTDGDPLGREFDLDEDSFSFED